MLGKKYIVLAMAFWVALICMPALAQEAPMPAEVNAYNTEATQYQQELTISSTACSCARRTGTS